MKVLLITNWYPPDQPVPARRWGNLVNFLQQSGVCCTVLTAGDGCLKSYLGRFGEEVIRIPIDNRKRPMSDVLNGGFLNGMRFYLLKMLRFFAPLVLRDSTVKGWLGCVWFSGDLYEYARSSDVIIASYGPLGPLAAGFMLSKRTGTPWIVDVRDAFESKDIGCFEISRRCSRSLERILLKTAVSRLTVGRILAEYLSKNYELSFHSIYNGWIDNDLIRDSDNVKKNIYFYYAGSIYKHQLPALEMFLDAMGLCGDYQLRLKIRLLSDDTGGCLRLLLNKHHAGNMVDLLPPVAVEQVTIEMQSALGSIVLEELDGDNKLRLGTVTGKLLGLLASGMPGIAISSSDGEIRTLVRLAPLWIGVSDTINCQKAILKLVGIAEGKCTHPSCNTLIFNYHMRQQASSLINHLQEVLSK